MLKVSVIIKALNEERHIAAAIESALQAVVPFDGEVILADSCSTDLTVAIAQAYPVKIARLVHPEERCCGIGAQLGFQYAEGEYLYILDGDMELRADFLAAAIRTLDQDVTLAGVGGLVVEHSLSSIEYQARHARTPANLKPGVVDRLDGGGLYRRSAIEATGYLTNRNLHAYEEFELAVRLRARGYRLCRIAMEAVDHYGHTLPAHQLLMRRWHSRYICGTGELLLCSKGEPHLPMVVRELGELRLYTAVLAWWCILLLILVWPMSLLLKIGSFTSLLIGPWFLMALKKRSFVHASYSLASWNVHAAGLLRGLFLHRVAPTQPIEAELLHAKPVAYRAADVSKP